MVQPAGLGISRILCVAPFPLGSTRKITGRTLATATAKCFKITPLMSTCLFPDTGPWTFWWFISNSTTRGLYPDLLIAKGASFPSCSGKTGSYWRIGIEEPLDSHSDSGEFTIDIQILWRFGVEHLEPK